MLVQTRDTGQRMAVTLPGSCGGGHLCDENTLVANLGLNVHHDNFWKNRTESLQDTGPA